MRSTILALVLVSIGCAPALADTATLAVATNFFKVAQTLVTGFETATGHRILLVPGSTGKHYAQIVNGAPFDMFLSADRARPARLEAEGLIVAGSRATYAIGRLALVAKDNRDLSDVKAALTATPLPRLALADAALAPYGQASEEVLAYLGLSKILAEQRVNGENVGQTFSFVATGNADLGFVALAQAKSALLANWVEIPSAWHQPIRQDMVLISRPEMSQAAPAFHAYLKSQAARKMIRDAGYEVGP